MSQVETIFIDLDPYGSGGAYRIKNAPNETTRKHLVDRGDKLMVQADIVDVLHRKLTPNGDPASLIVTDFFFRPLKIARRFKAVTVKFSFMSEDSSGEGPDVVAIAPSGHFSMHQTSKVVESGCTASASIQAPLGPVSPGLSYAVDLKESYDTKDQITLSGNMRYEHREYGEKDTAQWILIENRAQKSGIPTHLRTAILLQRNHSEADKRFQAILEIKAEVDFRSSIEDKFSGRTPKDDPIIFDPKKDASRREDLGKEDLSKLSQVTVTKMLSDEEVGGLKKSIP